jgi:checkpoint serine/threonine-protein kinase
MPESSSAGRSRDKRQLLQQQQKYRARINEALNDQDDDDPLAAYDKFIRWTLDNFVRDDPDAGLVQLVREATTTFQDDEAYKSDLRYYKLWSLYARIIEPTAALDVYSFMLEKEIGTMFSGLFQEYAKALEGAGRWVALGRVCN